VISNLYNFYISLSMMLLAMEAVIGIKNQITSKKGKKVMIWLICLNQSNYIYFY